MTYLACFIVIVVKGLFHSDWLGVGPAAIGPLLVAGQMGKSGNPPHYRCELGVNSGFLASTREERSHHTPHTF
jgi:hypothetical protein